MIKRRNPTIFQEVFIVTMNRSFGFSQIDIIMAQRAKNVGVHQIRILTMDGNGLQIAGGIFLTFFNHVGVGSAFRAVI